MAIPVVPIVLGLGLAGLAGYALLSSSGAKAGGKVPTTVTKDGKETPTIDLKTTTGYADGFKAGHVDGLSDGTAGLPSNPRPLLGYSSTPTEQAAYELGYDAGYAEGRDAGLAIKAFSTDSTGAVDDTKTDEAKGKAKVGTPADDVRGKNEGSSDGYYAGTQDYKEGIGDPSGSTSNRYHNLRNAVAGLPRSDAYKTGYVLGLDDGYSRGYNAARAGADVGGDAVNVGVERMVARGRGLTGVGFVDRRIGVGRIEAGARYDRPSLMAATRNRKAA